MFVRKVRARFFGIPELVTRLTMGWMFLVAGWGKLMNLSQVSEYFASLGIPAPYVQAAVVGAVEFIGGIALIAGLATSAFSTLLLLVMLVAIYTAKRSELTSFIGIISVDEVLYAMLLLWLAVYGAGKYAVDAICKKRFCK